jgi:hypothetical protein
MTDPLIEVFQTITSEQARLVYELISGFCEDTRLHADPDDDYNATWLAKLPAAEALVKKLDAAAASLAQEAK